MDRGVNRNAVIEESVCYKLCTILVDKLVAAQAADALPDGDTAKILALGSWAGSSAGGTNDDDDDDDGGGGLFGALRTLFLQGRCSRTMLELALIHSETSYPEYVQLWVRALPPNERSRATRKLCENNFGSVPWDHRFYSHSLQARRADYDGTAGRLVAMPTPPTPLGDHRHSRRRNSVRNAAYFFYEVLRTGLLFDSSGQDYYATCVDWHCPLAADYAEMVQPDILATLGPVFGIDKAELTFGVRSDAVSRGVADGDAGTAAAATTTITTPASVPTGGPSGGDCGGGTRNNIRTLSSSERILRTWNVLYHADRLCKTELEDALLRGPAAMRDLLERGATLLRMTWGQGGSRHPALTLVGGMADLVVRARFVELPVDQPELLECDHCGEGISRKEHCSRCRVAMYCNRECQRKDWKRHKAQCPAYAATAP
jgi:hypothetical protein